MKSPAPSPDERRITTLLCACAVAIVCVAGPGTVLAAELWGAYAGYHFDDIQGDEGYGVAWNHADPQHAVRAALDECRRRQPPPPVHTPDERASGAAPGRRCGDRVFAFSSAGPDPEHVLRAPDPDWGRDFERLTVHRRARCTAVFELSNHPDGLQVLGSNFLHYQGDDRAALEALGERLFGGEDRTAHEPYPNRDRVAIISCNDP